MNVDIVLGVLTHLLALLIGMTIGSVSYYRLFSIRITTMQNKLDHIIKGIGKIVKQTRGYDEIN